MNVSFYLSRLNNFSVNCNDVPAADENQETSECFDFSENDARFWLLVNAGICDLAGQATETVGLEHDIYNFAVIPADHSIHQTFHQLINSIKDDYFTSHIVKNSITHSKDHYPITEIQIAGSEAWRIILKHPDLLINTFAKFFEKMMTKEQFVPWFTDLLNQHESLQNQAGTEIDVRLICPNGTPKYFEYLSAQAKAFFLTYFAGNSKNFITKFNRVKGSTLAAFKILERELEFFFTNGQLPPLASEKSLVLSYHVANGKLEIKSLGFNLVQVLAGIVSKTSVPNPKNEQILFRQWGKSQYVSANDYESQTVNNSFNYLKNNDFNLCMLQLGYKQEIIGKALQQQAVFSSFEEEVITRYLYILFHREFNSKKHDTHANSTDSHALLVIQFCQRLLVYKKMTPKGIVALTSWLKEENLLVFPNTDPFIVELISQLVKKSKKPFPFPIFTSAVTLAALLYDSETYTKRQTPPIFHITTPYKLRIDTNLPEAVKTLRSYIEEEGDIKVLERIFYHFISGKTKNKALYFALQQELKLDKNALQKNAEFFLNHSDPFICYLGLELMSFLYPTISCLYAVNYLPKLVKLTPCQPLKELHTQILEEFQLEPLEKMDFHCLLDWLHLLTCSNHSTLIMYAHYLWKENILSLGQSIDTAMITALSVHDPRTALNIFLGILPYQHLDLGYIYQTLSKIQLNHPIPSVFHEESYLLIEKIILDKVTANDQFLLHPLCTFIVTYLSEFDNEDKKRYLLFAFVLKTNFAVQNLPENLQHSLGPIFPYLLQNQAQDLNFSKCKKTSPILLTDASQKVAQANIILRDVNLFLLQLPILLENPLDHVETLEVLFAYIIKKYPIKNVAKLNPLIIQDWIRLLAASQDIQWINLAFEVNKKFSNVCSQKNMVFLFEVLAFVDPCQALETFVNLYESSTLSFSTSQYEICLNFLKKGLERAKIKKIKTSQFYSILNDLLANKKLNVSKSKLPEILPYFINLEENIDRIEILLMQAITKGLINPKGINSSLLGLFPNFSSLKTLQNSQHQQDFQIACHKIGTYFLEENDKYYRKYLDQLLALKNISANFLEFHSPFFIKSLGELLNDANGWDKKTCERIERLIDYIPQTQYENIIPLITAFFEKILSDQTKTFSEHEILTLDRFFLKYKNIVHTTQDWELHLFNYLNKFQSTLERQSVIELFSLICTSTSPINHLDLLRTYSRLVNSHSPDKLPPSVKQFLQVNFNSVIATLLHERDWDNLKFYFHVYLSHFSSYELTEKIWEVCAEKVEVPDSQSMSYITSLLQLLNKEKLQTFLLEKLNHEKAQKIRSMIELFFENCPNIIPDQLANSALLLLEVYYQQPYLKEILTELKCSDEKFLRLSSSVLSLQPSILVKKQLFFSRNLQDEKSKELARHEIQKHLQNNLKVDFTYCLDIIDRYLPNDISSYFLIIKQVKKTKNPEIIARLISLLNGINDSLPNLSEQLLESWLTLFKHLKEIKSNKAWNYLENLPRVFDEECHLSFKKEADEVIIQAAIKNLLHDLQESQKKPLLNEIDLEKKKKEALLFNKFRSLSPVSVELYCQFFSIFADSFITQHSNEFLELSDQILINKNLASINKSIFTARFKKNLVTLLKNYSTENFTQLIGADDNQIKYIACLQNLMQLAIDFGWVNPSNFICLEDTAMCIIKYRYEFLSNNSELNAKIYEDFYHFFTKICAVTNFESIKSRNFSYYVVVLLSKILTHAKPKQAQIYNTRNQDVQNNKGAQELKYHEAFFLEVFNHCVEMMVPPNIEIFSPYYFKNIFKKIKLLNALPLEIELKKNLFEQLFKILELKIKQKNNLSLISIKKIFELSFKKEIEDFLQSDNHYEMTKNYLTSVMVKIRNYSFCRMDELYLKYSAMLQIDLELLGKISPDVKEKIYILAMNELYSCKASAGLTYATVTYFKVAFDFKMNLKFRLQILDVLIQRVIEEPQLQIVSRNIENRTTLYYLIENCLELLPIDTYRESQANIDEYMIKIYLSLFVASNQCVDKIKNSTNAEFDDCRDALLVHYTYLRIKILNDLMNLNFFVRPTRDSYYLDTLEIIFPQVIIGEKYLAQNNKSSSSSLKMPNPGQMLNAFSDMLLFGLKSPTVDFISQRFPIIQKFLVELNWIDYTENPELQENKCNLIIDALATLFYEFTDENQHSLYTTATPFLNWLLDYDARPSTHVLSNILLFHFQRPDNPEKITKFLAYTSDLVEFSKEIKYLHVLYIILLQKIDGVFFGEPTNLNYRLACIEFLRLQLKLFSKMSVNPESFIQATSVRENSLVSKIYPTLHLEDYSDLLISSSLVVSYLTVLIRFKILVLNNSESMDIFDIVKAWFDVHNLDITLLALPKRMLECTVLTEEACSTVFARFLPVFVYYARKHNILRFSYDLERLINTLPNHKMEIMRLWETYIKSEIVYIAPQLETEKKKS